MLYRKPVFEGTFLTILTYLWFNLMNQREYTLFTTLPV